MAMFENDRYITRGIQSRIPDHLIRTMWNIIDMVPAEHRDYLQIFELDIIGNGSARTQIIKHWQEEPEYYSPIVYIPYGEFFKGEIFVIDDGPNSVMCFPDER